VCVCMCDCLSYFDDIDNKFQIKLSALYTEQEDNNALKESSHSLGEY
jgi:hypothetical protein